MRNAAEIKNLVLNFALSEGKVRAILLNGSRANPNLKPDRLQDFDIVFVVEDLESFTADHTWTNFFWSENNLANA